MNALQYYSPTELVERAQETMIVIESQKKAQEEIATMISMHLARIQALNRGTDPQSIPSNSAFLIGSTGSGKSYIIKHLAESCGLAFEQVNCASLTQAGYKGCNVADCLLDISKKSPNMFTHGGIINLDEADKCMYTGNAYHDSYNVQQDLLKLLEGGTYSFTANSRSETVCLDKVLFLLSGACAKVAMALQANANQCGSAADEPKLNGYVGFTVGGFAGVRELHIGRPAKADYTSQITLDNLVDHGLMPEIASRVNSVIHIPTPTAEDYEKMVTASAKTSAMNRFRVLFAARGIDLEVTPNAVSKIAQMCVERNVGIRSVQAIFNEHLVDAYRKADSCSDYNRVILQTNRFGDLEACLIPGQRIVPEDEPILHTDVSDLDLRYELRSEEGINQFCAAVCQNAQLSSIAREPVLYYFLQVTCHYLAWNCRPQDRCYASLCKLAKTVDYQSDEPGCITPFDIICTDYLKLLDKQMAETTQTAYLQIKQRLFAHYYGAFKKAAGRGSQCSSVLLRALSAARNDYVPRRRKNNPDPRE